MHMTPQHAQVVRLSSLTPALHTQRRRRTTALANPQDDDDDDNGHDKAGLSFKLATRAVPRELQSERIESPHTCQTKPSPSATPLKSESEAADRLLSHIALVPTAFDTSFFLLPHVPSPSSSSRCAKCVSTRPPDISQTPALSTRHLFHPPPPPLRLPPADVSAPQFALMSR